MDTRGERGERLGCCAVPFPEYGTQERSKFGKKTLPLGLSTLSVCAGGMSNTVA